MVSANRLVLLGAAALAAPAAVSASVTCRMLQSGQCGESEVANRITATMATRMISGLEIGNCADVGYTVPAGHTTSGACPGDRCAQVELYAPTGATICGAAEMTPLTTACGAFSDFTDAGICGTDCETQARALMGAGGCFSGGDVQSMLDSVVSTCAGYVAVGDASMSCNTGLYFEGYVGSDLPAGAFSFQSLDGANFDAWTPSVSHADHTADIDFENDDAFVNDIDGFTATDQYLMRWRGHFNADTQGFYTFSTTSDDGSMLYIDGAVVVDNDGLHGPTRREGIITLSPGPHAIVITFFENNGGAKMQATVNPPNGGEQVLGGAWLSNPFGCGDDMAAQVGNGGRCAIDFCEDPADCPTCEAGLRCSADGAQACAGTCFGTCVSTETFTCSTCADLGWANGRHDLDDNVCAESDGQNMPGWDSCEEEITQSDAEQHCQEVGARLCTAMELFDNGEGTGTGCGHDARLIWSSSSTLSSGGFDLHCAAYEKVVVPGNVARMGRYHLAPACVNVQETGAALRCCADVVCSNTQAVPDIVALAQSVDALSTLVTALIAGGLVPVLQGPGPFTVFAPTNDAFAALGQDTINALLADHDRLVDVLTYHVLPAEVHSTDLSNGMTATTVEGGALRIAINGRVEEGAPVVILGGASHATVVQADVQASNGVVHVIDTVLFPSAAAMGGSGH